MIRLAWRQFRSEATVAIGLLAVVAVVLAITGPHLETVFRTAPNQLVDTFHDLQTAMAGLLLVVPTLVGMFFGAPLVARELETGTFRLAWTQSATRVRWLAVKLGLVGLASTLVAGGLSLMGAWWANPIDIENANRFSPSNFDILGIVPFGYALFAFALGSTTGLVFRRTLPAVAATLAGYVGVRFLVTCWIRPRFEAPLHFSSPLSASSGFEIVRTNTGGLSVGVQPPVIPNGWGLSAKVVDNAGHSPTSAFAMKACPGIGGPIQGVSRVAGGLHTQPAPGGDFRTCVANLASRFHALITYQPASRYWPFQAYETVLFIVLALALASISFWWVRRRLT